MNALQIMFYISRTHLFAEDWMISIYHIVLVQPCLSQEGQNVFHFDILKQTSQTIHLEKLLSDESENFTFYENVFNGAKRLTCQTLW